MAKIVVTVVAISVLPALAQTTPERVRVIRLEEDVIEAAPQRPEAMPFVNARHRRSHDSLIRIRKDFRQEVLSSIARL